MLDGRGRAIARLAEPMPPAAVRGVYGLTLVTPARPAGTARVAAGPLPNDGRARLLVRRVGARVCADIDRANLMEPACGLPPRTAEESLIAGRGTAGGDTVGGVVAPGVAEVELSASIGGASVRVPTRPARRPRAPSRCSSVSFRSAASSACGCSTRVGAPSAAPRCPPPTRPATPPRTPPGRLLRGRAPGGGAFVLRGDPAGLCIALTAPGRKRRRRRRVDVRARPCRAARTLPPPARRRRVAGKGRAALHVLTWDGDELRGSARAAPRRPPGVGRTDARAGRAASGGLARAGAARGRRPRAGPGSDRQCGYTAGPDS